MYQLLSRSFPLDLLNNDVVIARVLRLTTTLFILRYFLMNHHVIWLFLSSGEDIHLEEALKDGTVRLEHLARTVLAALAPLALVHGAIRPVHLTVTLSLVVSIVALVHVTRLPSEDSVAMLLVHVVAALVVVAVGFIALPPLTLAVLEARLEVPDVETSILPLVLTETVRLPGFVLALVCVTISEEIGAMPMFEALLPLALVLVPVPPYVDAVPMRLALLPLPYVALAVLCAPPYPVALLLPP